MKENRKINRKPVTIKIIERGSEEKTKEVEGALQKYDIPEMVSEMTGLKWKKNSIKLQQIENGANFEKDYIVLINLNMGIYCLSGITHETVHLILRQNNWLENEEIHNFVNKYPEMKKYPKDREGYPLEQMIAYLIMEDISKPIGKKEGLEKLAETGGHGSFEKILEREFGTETKEKIGKMIIEKWPEHKNYSNVIEWLESIIKQFEERNKV